MRYKERGKRKRGTENRGKRGGKEERGGGEEERERRGERGERGRGGERGGAMVGFSHSADHESVTSC